MRYLSSLFLFFLLVSCKSHDVPRLAQMNTDRHQIHILQRADTIVRIDSIVQVIEHPPERYVPKFYKCCTIALWAIGLLVMGYWALRRWL